MKKILLLSALFFLCFNLYAQLNVGLVANWQFNGNTIDSSANAFNGNMNNISFDTSRYGVPNGAAKFDGRSSFITVPYKPAMNINKYSLCATVKLNGFYTGTCHVNMIFCRGGLWTNGNYGMEFTDTVNNNCGVPADTNTFTALAETGPNGLNLPTGIWHYHTFLRTGQWYRIIATYDSFTTRIYINGELVDTASPKTAAVPIGSSTDSLFIGTLYQGPGSPFPYWFNGLMDDLRIYNRVLSAAEITAYDTLNKSQPPVVTSVNNFEKDKIEVALYPNPAHSGFTIDGQVTADGPAQVYITNSVGQVLQTEMINITKGNLKKEIKLNNLPQGLYFVQLKAERTTKVLKLTIE